MTKLATVTTLRPRGEPDPRHTPDDRDTLTAEAYWERVQALRAELALLDTVG